MKVLIVGSEIEIAIENYFLRYLNELGAEVKRFSAQGLFLNHYHKSVMHKLSFKLGVSGVYARINRALEKLIVEMRPDILWVFKGMEVFPETLAMAKSRGIKLVNYNPDNPFIFSGFGSGNKNISKSIGLYDLHFTYNREVKVRLDSEFGVNSVLLPFAFDLDEEVFEACRSLPEIFECCFLGNPDKERAFFLTQLAAESIPISVYGHGWQRFVNASSIRVHPTVTGLAFWKILRQYRVQLNLMRPHNRNSHNMRTFEVPSIGGILLAPNTSDHSTFFKENEEAFFYSDISDCISKIKKIMRLPEDRACTIRDAARKRSISSSYSYRDRSIQVFHKFRELLDD